MSKLAEGESELPTDRPRAGRVGTMALLALGIVIVVVWSILLPICGILYLVEHLG